MQTSKSITLAITGASGVLYGIKALELLRAVQGVEVHLVVSPSAWLTLSTECELSRSDVEALADVVHHPKAVGDCVASGSFPSIGMLIAPCSMRTLAAVAHGLSDNLITRAADVTLKERRKLVLLPRETPLNLAHLRNMTAVTEMGGIIMPPVPAWYQRPASLEELVTDTVAHALQLFGLEEIDRKVWKGVSGN